MPSVLQYQVEEALLVRQTLIPIINQAKGDTSPSQKVCSNSPTFILTFTLMQSTVVSLYPGNLTVVPIRTSPTRFGIGMPRVKESRKSLAPSCDNFAHSCAYSLQSLCRVRPKDPAAFITSYTNQIAVPLSDPCPQDWSQVFNWHLCILAFQIPLNQVKQRFGQNSSMLRDQEG